MEQITVDDRDPRITYFGSWTYGGVQQEYWGTTSGAMTSGLRMMFTFNGTWIGVYGTVGLEGVNASFVLDNGASTPYLYLSPATTEYRQAYFESGPLSLGEHTVEMTNLGNGTVSFLDYFLYNTTAQAGVSATMTSLVTVTASAQVLTSRPSEATYKIGIVVAAVVPTIICACVLSLFVVRFRRLSRQYHLLLEEQEWSRASGGHAMPTIGTHSLSASTYTEHSSVSMMDQCPLVALDPTFASQGHDTHPRAVRSPAPPYAS